MTRVFDYQIEREFKALWLVINTKEQPDCVFPTVDSFQLFDAKTHEIDEKLTGRAQTARCIYCNKIVAAWGPQTRGKKNTRHGHWARPDALANASQTHTLKCAEDWVWRTLSRWALDTCRSDAERLAIETWYHGLKRGDADRGRINPSEYFVLRVFDRLPTKDIAIVQAIELGLVQGAIYELRDWIASDIVDIHGMTETNPHVFLPTAFGDAEWGIWGICPCGAFEYRGPDMSPADRLIGWGEPRRVHRIPPT